MFFECKILEESIQSCALLLDSLLFVVNINLQHMF